MACLENVCSTAILSIGMKRKIGVRLSFYVHNFVHNESHLVFRSASSVYPHPAYASREYPTGWVGIDKDDEPSEKDFY